MARLKTDKALYQEVVLDQETGEVTRHKTVYKAADEPDFVKLYIDCVLTLKGLKKGLNPILLGFLRFMSYADINGIEGGQIIFVNKMMKQTIADSLGTHRPSYYRVRKRRYIQENSGRNVSSQSESGRKRRVERHQEYPCYIRFR